MFHKKAKVTKKITLKMKCEKCSQLKMKNLGNVVLRVCVLSLIHI